MKLKYYHNLDGVRGIAALMVVVFHFFTYPNSSYLEKLILFQKITEFGQHGVSLFFVLSGFVITRILINTRNDQEYFKTFYKRRILRILPLYYLFLFVYYIFTPSLTDTDWIDFNFQLPFYFYLQNLTEILNIKALGPGHYWSLAVEEHFYLLWPLAIFIVKPKNTGRLIGMSILLIFILKYFMLINNYSINVLTFTRIDQILIGAFLAVLEKNGFFLKNNSQTRMLLIGLSIIPFAILIYVFSPAFPFLKEMSKYFILGMLFFCILGYLIASNSENIFNKYLSGSLLQYLGRISYGIYVWHILVLLILNKFFISQVLVVDILITIILTIFIAHLSYYYFEKKFIIFKDRKILFRKIFVYLRLIK